MTEVTELLNRWGEGKQDVLDQLMPLVYAELRKLARSYVRNERPNHTLNATALVNEAYIRLAGQKSHQWQNRSHFFGIAAQLMRRVLVDHARRKRSDKRGGGEVAIEFDENKGISARPSELIALDDALKAFAQLDERGARIVELRQFGGLTNEEVADVLHISPATVKREWSAAKAWLKREIAPDGAPR